jgi:selenide,water dikinase
VDDPRTFGAIAATNALNDVFAMGGTPLLALSVAAFPEELPTEVLGEVLAGAAERVQAAGAILAGGHTIRDDEPKYGLAVVGTVHPDAVWPKAGARAGDALFLTKPLGTGIVLQAHRDGNALEGALDAAIESMVELNSGAADALRPFEPNAVTDVTGFGLLGHVHELASRSGVRAVLEAGALPLLPAAAELAEAGVRTGGDRRNREFAASHVESAAPPALEALAYDPQTAGGLLVSLPAERAAVLEAGGLRLDPATRRAWRDGVEVELTARELALLEFLLRRRGEAVSKREILQHVWDDQFEGDPNIVEVYVRHLRNKLDRPFGRAAIQTVRGTGYRLAADGG